MSDDFVVNEPPQEHDKDVQDRVRLLQADELARRLHQQELAKRRKAEREEDGTGLPERAFSITEFLAQVSEEYEWVVPGRIPKGARLTLTGGEGGGKSTLFRWIAICTAVGRDPFTFAEIEPRRVMIVDAENPHNLVKRRLLAAIEEARGMGADMEILGANLFIESRPEGIEFSDPDDITRLAEIIADRRPELLAIGPIYRLSGLDEASEAFFDTITGAIDKVRVKHGLTVMLEAHTTHAQRVQGGGESRSKRPIGSSGWMRWTEIGLHIGTPSDTGIQRLVHWRPSRFGDDISWPTALVRVIGSQVRWLPSNDNGVPSEGDELVAAIQEEQRRMAFRLDERVQKLLNELRIAPGGWTMQAEACRIVPRPEGMTIEAHDKAIARMLTAMEEVKMVRSHKGPNTWGLRADRKYWSATEIGIASSGVSAHPTIIGQHPTDGLSDGAEDQTLVDI